MPKATIPIYHDDDFERLSELRREVAIAERKVEAEKDRLEAPIGSPRRVGDEAPTPDALTAAEEYLQAAQDAFDAFIDKAAERAENWVIKPIGHEEFRNLLKDHPPRKVKEGDDEVTHPDDVYFDVNTETFPKALLLFVDPDDEDVRTVVEPRFDSEAALRKRVKRLSEGEFETMWTAAYQANKGGISDPKSLRFSPAGQRSDAT